PWMITPPLNARARLRGWLGIGRADAVAQGGDREHRGRALCYSLVSHIGAPAKPGGEIRCRMGYIPHRPAWPAFAQLQCLVRIDPIAEPWPVIYRHYETRDELPR